MADHAGDATDLLITNRDLGRELAAHLGEASVVPMRAHGYTVVAGSVPGATYRAIYTMRNCEIELAARTLGTPAHLSEGEAAACERSLAGQADRAWNLWLRGTRRRVIPGGLTDAGGGRRKRR